LINITGTLAFKEVATFGYRPLRRLGFPMETLAISRVGLGHTSVAYEDLARLVDQRYLAERPLVLMGHSQGGFLAQLYAVRHPGRVSAVITCGTPYRGAPACIPLRLLPLAGLRCMSPGSRFLGQIQAEVQSQLALGSLNLHAFASVLDELVPAPFAYVPGAQNHLIAPRLLHRPLRHVARGYTLHEGLADHFSLPLSRPVMRILRQSLMAAVTTAAA
jgi:pimeloyl-ACP methyl ester carboxylesterase